MTLAELIEESRVQANARGAGNDRYGELDIISWLNDAQNQFTADTRCLVNGSYVTAVNWPWTDLACADHVGPPFDVTSAIGGFTNYFTAGGSLAMDVGAHWLGGNFVISVVAAGTLSLATDPTDGQDATAGVGRPLSTTVVKVGSVQGLMPKQYIDIIKGDGTVQVAGKKITSIANATKALTMASAVNCTDGAKVWLRNDSGEIDTVADQTDYDLPWSCLAILKVAVKDASAQDPRVLRQQTLEDQVSGENRGIGGYQLTPGRDRPWMYVPIGLDKVRLYPAPGNSVTKGLMIEYVRRPLPLMQPDDVSDIPETYHRALSSWAAFQMLSLDGNDVQAQRQIMMFQRAVAQANLAMGNKPPNVAPSPG